MTLNDMKKIRGAFKNFRNSRIKDSIEDRVETVADWINSKINQWETIFLMQILSGLSGLPKSSIDWVRKKTYVKLLTFFNMSSLYLFSKLVS